VCIKTPKRSDIKKKKMQIQQERLKKNDIDCKAGKELSPELSRAYADYLNPPTAIGKEHQGRTEGEQWITDGY
jgi:hypothetical protein